MRIGIEAQRIFRERKHGIEIVALEVIRELQRIDKKNEYFIFAKQDADMSCLSETENFRIIVLPPANFAWWEQVMLPSAAKKYNLDILHCTGNTAPIRRTTKTLLTIHDIFFTSYANIKGSTYQVLGNIYRKMIFPKLASYDHLITVSETEKNNIVSKLGISPDKIDVIYNGVNPKFRPVHDEVLLASVKEKYNLPSKFVFFFSNTAPKKNTIKVLQAFGELLKNNSEAELVVTDPSGYYVRDCIEKLNLPGLKDKVKILGFVNNDDLPAIYNLAAIYLFPSLEESFGLPIIEAQACGTPVITSNQSAMPEIAADSALLTDPNSVADIAESVGYLWKHQEQRDALRQKGYMNAKRFSWNHTATQLLDLYMKMG
jgi:glycosyltransferase involved in cell wall biosynthesis